MLTITVSPISIRASSVAEAMWAVSTTLLARASSSSLGLMPFAVLEHVERRARQVPALDAGDQRLLVDQLRPRDIDHEGVLPHPPEPLGDSRMW